MDILVTFLFSVFCPLFSDAFMGMDSIFNLWPWKKVLPDSGYEKNVQLRLVKKDWMPPGITNVNSDIGVLDSFPGTVPQAFKAFMNETLYEYEARTLDVGMELLSEQFGYNPELDSILIIQTISGDADSFFIKNTIAALAMRNIVRNYNVFAFNMPSLQASMEQTIARSVMGMNANFYGLGEAIGSFFMKAIQANLMKTEGINLIGFSYSSQLSGFIARHIKEHNNGQRIKSILGLDPYSIGFSSVRNQIVSAEDAETVHLLHTNSLAFGSLYRRGTADFDFNNGSFQPGCLFSPQMECSHRRAVLILWYVILYSHKFQARSCPHYFIFIFCWCQKNPIVTLTYPPNIQARGKHVMVTAAHRPYGYGIAGAKCRAKRKQERVLVRDDSFTEGKL